MAFLTNGQDDYAVIVGLQVYPGLDDPQNGINPLSGPENDASDFYNWIISPTGGNLLPQNVSKILSSDYPPPPADESGYLNALPAGDDIIKVFEKIRQRSLANLKNRIGSRIGRRLYIFMSGHGIAPSTSGNKLEKEAALLTCNVPPDNKGAVSYHIPGGYTANWFCENDCFEEVFLFMDCCRDPAIVNAINMYFPAKGNKDDTTRFYAFSTRWSRRSREKLFDGKMRGIFTKTLLDALNGASAIADPNGSNQTIITGRSLKNFLFANISKEVDPQFQEPDIDFFPKRNEGEDILVRNLGNLPLDTFPIEIAVPASASGTLQVLDSNLDVVNSFQIQNPPLVIALNLPVGKYLMTGTVNSQAKSVRFDILGSESNENNAHISL